MQIGYPTDVKHVAHIGWDGPSVHNPSWMNEFRSAPLTATVTEDDAEVPKFPSSEFVLPSEPQGPPKSEKPVRRKKSTERSSEGAGAVDSPKRESASSKHSRRRQSSAGGSGGESAEGSRRSRRESRDRNCNGEGTGGEVVSVEREPPGIPKQTRRRRTKGAPSNSGGGESSRPKSRAHGNADLGSIQEESGETRPPPKPAKERGEEVRS
ncbi:hypothetical protein HPP92_025450 [Vanilla planifolia]|uniref:CRIB domain-containing protein n=1 Tax=Vanilla planifolia TaxID=51239 RepID=A0A835PHX9_VANPL|nr:hypothetical protein HPP92_025450 [Vanilla planifolia]